MYVEDLVGVEQTNLITTRRNTRTVGIEYNLLSSSSLLDSLSIGLKPFLTFAIVILQSPSFGIRKAGLIGSCLNSRTNSRKSILVTKMRRFFCLRFPLRHQFSLSICLTKSFAYKEISNTFPIPEILHVFLLGILLADRAFQPLISRLLSSLVRWTFGRAATSCRYCCDRSRLTSLFLQIH